MPKSGCAFSFKPGETNNPGLLHGLRKTFPKVLPSVICLRRTAVLVEISEAWEPGKSYIKPQN
jgi:hypothetical protein